MTTTIIEPSNREIWLEARKANVNASEVASLFDTGYMSRYELWHIKSGHKQADFDSERMKWGRRLERAIAEGICEDEGLTLIDLPVQYFSNPETRMGATPDFFVDHPTKGRGLLQIKNVDSLIFKQKWTKPQDGGEAPDYIEMQVQQEMLLTGCTWAKIGVLVGGNQTYVYDREFYPEVGTGLRSAVTKFWDSVDNKIEPTPDFLRDADFIIEMMSKVSGGKSVDMSGDERLETLMRGYNEWQQKEKEADEMKKSHKAEILMLVGDNETILTGVGKISAKEVKGSDGTLITPEMVGTRVGGRSGYRTFKVSVKEAVDGNS